VVARIGVFSLSSFTHVAEGIDLAATLAARHQVRLFAGSRAAAALIEDRGLACQTAFDVLPELTPPHTRDAFALLSGHFLRHAELCLPRLLPALERWGPDLLLVHLRDYAGFAAAEKLGIPLVSFGSHTSPERVEPEDPPFGAGLGADARPGVKRLMWERQHQLDARLDRLHDERIRKPLGLAPAKGTSSLRSSRLILLGLLSALTPRCTPEPGHVRYVGPLFRGLPGQAGDEERRALARLADMPRPRVFVSLGTVYRDRCLGPVLDALRDFDGTLVVAGGTPEGPRLVAREMFTDLAGVHALVDAVVTTGSGKTVMAALGHGRPMVCVPQQGEQREIARSLAARGAAAFPCPRRFDPGRFSRAVAEVAASRAHAEAACGLGRGIDQAHGLERAGAAIEALL
jgi:UDP:flavonoid glycosyltransferase YjiC (YdhE family)